MFIEKNKAQGLCFIFIIISLIGCSKVETSKTTKPEPVTHYKYQKVIAGDAEHCPIFLKNNLDNNNIEFPLIDSKKHFSLWSTSELTKCQWRSFERNRVLTKEQEGYHTIGLLTYPILDTEKIARNDKKTFTVEYKMSDLSDKYMDRLMNRLVDEKYWNNSKKFNSEVNFKKLSIVDLFRQRNYALKAYVTVKGHLGKINSVTKSYTKHTVEDDEPKSIFIPHSVAFNFENKPKRVKRLLKSGADVRLYIPLDPKKFSAVTTSAQLNSSGVFTPSDAGTTTNRADNVFAEITISSRNNSIEFYDPTVFLHRLSSSVSNKQDSINVVLLLNNFLDKGLISKSSVKHFFKNEIKTAEKRWKTLLRRNTPNRNDPTVLEFLNKISPDHSSAKYLEKYNDFEKYFPYYTSHSIRLKQAIRYIKKPYSPEVEARIFEVADLILNNHSNFYGSSQDNILTISERFALAKDADQMDFEKIIKVFEGLFIVTEMSIHKPHDEKTAYIQKKSVQIAKKINFDAVLIERIYNVSKAFSQAPEEFYYPEKTKQIIREVFKLSLTSDLNIEQISRINTSAYRLHSLHEVERREYDVVEDGVFGHAVSISKEKAYTKALHYIVSFDASIDDFKAIKSRLLELIYAKLDSIPDGEPRVVEADLVDAYTDQAAKELFDIDPPKAQTYIDFLSNFLKEL